MRRYNEMGIQVCQLGNSPISRAAAPAFSSLSCASNTRIELLVVRFKMSPLCVLKCTIEAGITLPTEVTWHTLKSVLGWRAQ